MFKRKRKRGQLEERVRDYLRREGYEIRGVYCHDRALIILFERKSYESCIKRLKRRDGLYHYFENLCRLLFREVVLAAGGVRVKEVEPYER